MQIRLSSFYIAACHRKCKLGGESSNSSTSSKISTAAIEDIINDLKLHKYRDSTHRNYYGIWKTFNEFYIKLDRKPRAWEDRIVLFAAHLISENRKSTTIKSYVSAIKAVLSQINIKVHEDTCLINSLTRACKLEKDRVSVRFPIRKPLLNIILKTTEHHFLGAGQVYLAHMYMALFSTAYYGLFRVGEITWSPHNIKAIDVHIGENKNKILFILRSLKTHTLGDPPQMITISSSRRARLQHHYCPFNLLRKFLEVRRGYLNPSEPFFHFFGQVVCDIEPVQEYIKNNVAHRRF